MKSALILGASYGSLVATKLLMAGHRVSLVCTRPTAGLINRDGTIVRFPLKGRAAPVAIASTELPGALFAAPPDEIDPGAFDLVVLGMQEAQYSAPDVRALMLRIGRAAKPCLAIMNMPPLAYLRRIPGLDVRALTGAYTDPDLWDAFDPALMSLASPDPQAFRPAGEPKNVLEVGLATNFKAARFAADAPSALLATLEEDIERARFIVDGAPAEIPVKLKVHDSIYVPLAKWPMLMTGNYRCVRPDAMIPIREAVHADPVRSRAIYESVAALCVGLGAHADDLVPFDKYAQAAASLGKPSSAARALASGAERIERVDRLVHGIACAHGRAIPAVAEIVALVDEKLRRNALSSRVQIA